MVAQEQAVKALERGSILRAGAPQKNPLRGWLSGIRLLLLTHVSIRRVRFVEFQSRREISLLFGIMHEGNGLLLNTDCLVEAARFCVSGRQRIEIKDVLAIA